MLKWHVALARGGGSVQPRDARGHRRRRGREALAIGLACAQCVRARAHTRKHSSMRAAKTSWLPGEVIHGTCAATSSICVAGNRAKVLTAGLVNWQQCTHLPGELVPFGRKPDLYDTAACD